MPSAVVAYAIAQPCSPRFTPVHLSALQSTLVALLCLSLSNTYRTACLAVVCRLAVKSHTGCNIPPTYPIGM